MLNSRNWSTTLTWYSPGAIWIWVSFGSFSPGGRIMRRLMYILLAVLLVGRSNSLSLGEEISAAELKERLSAANRAIKNASFTVTYDDSIDGSPDQYSVVRIAYDSS